MLESRVSTIDIVIFDKWGVKTIKRDCNKQKFSNRFESHQQSRKSREKILVSVKDTKKEVRNIEKKLRELCYTNIRNAFSST